MNKLFAFPVFALLLFSCSETQTDKTTSSNKEEKENINLPPDPYPENSSEKSTDENTIEIVAKESGKLEWISSKENIRKGTTIYRLKNATAFRDLYQQKSLLKTQLDSLITSCPPALNPVRNKWEQFYVNFKLDSLTPVFPKLEFREELAHFGSDSFVSSYNAIVKKEKGMKKYFGQASENMTEIQWYKKAGDQVKKGETIGVANLNY